MVFMDFMELWSLAVRRKAPAAQVGAMTGGSLLR